MSNPKQNTKQRRPRRDWHKTVVALLALLMALLMILPMITVVFQTAGAAPKRPRIISLFIIANTIKLATFHRREEIAIMKMCGATNWFVRWPFIFEGMILGLLGAVLAFFLQWGIYSLIVSAISEQGGLQLIAIVPFQTLAARVLGAFVAAGLAIGACGSLMAIRKFLQV